MTKPYSEDLRSRIVQAVETQGISQPIVAQRFAVSLTSVKRYLRQYRTTGTLTAATAPGRPRAIPPAVHADLVAQFDADPDATFATYCDQWAATTGVRVSESTMYRVQRRVGWTRKKSR
jgi:transposase